MEERWSGQEWFTLCVWNTVVPVAVSRIIRLQIVLSVPSYQENLSTETFLDF